MRGGEAIIESLKKMGVETIFGYPGGQTIPFYDMLYDADINHILVRHEQAAAHAADGWIGVLCFRHDPRAASG